MRTQKRICLPCAITGKTSSTSKTCRSPRGLGCRLENCNWGLRLQGWRGVGNRHSSGFSQPANKVRIFRFRFRMTCRIEPPGLPFGRSRPEGLQLLLFLLVRAGSRIDNRDLRLPPGVGIDAACGFRRRRFRRLDIGIRCAGRGFVSSHHPVTRLRRFFPRS